MLEIEQPSHTTLNIAATCPVTKTLGPGNRYVVWVQGCCFNCRNCASPDWREIKEAMRIRSIELAERVIEVPGIEGLTISGGEPMLQARGLSEAVKIIRTMRNISVICYTGFRLEALRDQKEASIDEFLSTIDVLIDGPYIDELNDNIGWRGSSNQRVHFLSGRYQELKEEFHHRRRDVEIHLHHGYYLLVGIKPKHIPDVIL